MRKWCFNRKLNFNELSKLKKILFFVKKCEGTPFSPLLFFARLIYNTLTLGNFHFHSKAVQRRFEERRTRGKEKRSNNIHTGAKQQRLNEQN